MVWSLYQISMERREFNIRVCFPVRHSSHYNAHRGCSRDCERPLIRENQHEISSSDVVSTWCGKGQGDTTSERDLVTKKKPTQYQLDYNRGERESNVNEQL